jgi:hypothetical protein
MLNALVYHVYLVKHLEKFPSVFEEYLYILEFLLHLGGILPMLSVFVFVFFFFGRDGV